MSNLSTVYQAAQQIAASGRQPNMALVKAKVGRSVSTKDILEGLQQWKSNPELGKELVNKPLPEQRNRKTAEQIAIDQQIAEAVAPLIARIEQLEQRLKQLE